MERFVVIFSTYTEQCLLHVKAHLIVVKPHDSHETLKGADLYLNRGVLGCLAHDLHDVVPLALNS